MKQPGHRSHVSGVRRMLSGKKASAVQDKLRAHAAQVAKRMGGAKLVHSPQTRRGR